MFPDELEAAFEACPVAYLPYGLCEPHGPQNAVGMDALRAHAALCQTAEAFGGISLPRNTGIVTKSACTPPGLTGRLGKPDLGLQLSRHGSI